MLILPEKFEQTNLSSFFEPTACCYFWKIAMANLPCGANV